MDDLGDEIRRRLIEAVRGAETVRELVDASRELRGWGVGAEVGEVDAEGVAEELARVWDRWRRAVGGEGGGEGVGEGLGEGE